MAKKVYEEANIRAIADKIREKSGSNSTYKTSEMPNGIDEVYEAGQNSMIDESKIIKGTATGEGSLVLNDVSEVPHKIKATIKVNESETFIAADVYYHFELPYDDTKPMPIKEINEAENKIICEYEYSWDGIEMLPHTCTITVLEGFDFSILKGALGIVSSYYATEFTVVHAKATSITLTVTDNDTKSATYRPNADGVIDNIVSYSPNMKFKLDGTNEITVEYHKSWGMQEEWNRFWDTYQDNGNRSRYAYAFAGVGWARKNMLPPKYPIVLQNGTFANRGMFQQFNQDKGSAGRYNLTEISSMIDASNMTNAHSMFADARVENLTLDLSNCTDATSMFNMGNAGGDVDGIYLKVSEKLKITTSMFAHCKNLKTLRFTEGSVLATSLSFAHSPMLDDESIDNIITTLKDLTGATAKTLTVHANVYDRMVERGVDALVTAKNWTLVRG